MSNIVRTVETNAEVEFNKNPTSLITPRAIYSNAIESRTRDRAAATSEKEREECEEDICGLYISRAAMEIRLNQKKQAKLVFDEALKIDFCRKSVLIWKAYINFYIREGKYDSARKYFKEAVKSVDVRFGNA